MNSKGNKLANNDVEKLVGVSDTTAERYLDELPAWHSPKAKPMADGEKEGKIRQVGEAGEPLFFIPKFTWNYLRE